MMPADGIVADRRCQKVGRNQLGPLVNQLVESMLTVCARLAPDDRSGLIIDPSAPAVHRLAVALHVALLEVGRKSMHILIVGQNHFGLGLEEIVVPDPDQGQDDRYVLVERCFPEVPVHVIGPLQQFGKILEPDSAGDREPDGRPQRIAPTDPVPEDKHILPVDPEFLDFFDIGRERRKVPGHMSSVPGAVQEPPAGRVGIGHGFLGRKGLGGNHEERGLGIQVPQGFADVRPVDVRHEMDGRLVGIGFKALGDHHRPEVGPADADVDDIGDFFAGVALPLPGPDLVRECLHPVQDGIDLGHHVLSVYENRHVFAVAQGHVQNSALLGLIDFLTREHALDGAR